MKLAIAQGLMGLCAACIIMSLADRKTAPICGALALAASSALCLAATHFLLGYVYVFASIPIFAASFAICMVSNGSHMLSERERRLVERFLSWEEACSCGAS
ncbi:hypothetical protein EON81_15635 [bacterium]|nr:MAG: hypothetical protein EON81_15635 [bacterium]